MLATFVPGLPGDLPVLRGVLALLAIVVLTLPACEGRKHPEPVLLNTYTDVPVVPNQPMNFPLPRSTKPILVEILNSEAKLDSQVILASSEVTSHVRFEFQRSVPIFHYVDPVHADNAPSLLIKPVQAPREARLSVRIYALPNPDGGNRNLAEAWKDLARGQQLVGTMDQQAWIPNLSALESARKRFDRLNLDINALWAAYLKAFTLYFPLYRYSEAAGSANLLLEEIDDLERSGMAPDQLDTLRVLTHQLAGQILLEFDARGDQQQKQSRFEIAREHFNAARFLAESSGMQFEETWAINNLGISYYYEDQLDLALEHYALALNQSESSQDAYLIALIGSNMAVEQQRRGHVNEAVHTLQRIEHAPAMRDNPVEREHVLGLLGHYYLKLYRFPEALEALNEALYWSELLESSESRGRNRFKLGRAYREMGQTEKARSLVQKAVPDLEAVQDLRELSNAHQLLADLYRANGNYEAMLHHRMLEGEVLDTERDRADWLFSRAEDALAQNQKSLAVEGFRDSARVYGEAGFTSWSDFATLSACAAGITPEHTALCSIEQVRPRYQEIRKIQASAPALQARFDWVRLLTSQGEQEAALREARDLVDSIQFYRQVLPGVLGAWYWDARQKIFTHYLQLKLDLPGSANSSKTDALLALDRLRNSALRPNPGGESGVLNDSKPLDSSDSLVEEAQDGGAGSIRSLLALRDQAETPEEAVRAQRLIDRELILRRQSASGKPAVSVTDFLSQLRTLPDDWSVVSYYLAGPDALAWVGHKAGLQLVDLGPSDAILELINRVRTGLRIYNQQSLDSDLAALGEALVSPILPQLKFNVLVSAGGGLSDLPLELLPIEGHPLIENHQVMHIQSIQNISRSVNTADSAVVPRQIFLAGDPGAGQSAQGVLPGTQRELQAVREIFPAATTVIHRQDTLDVQVFRGEAFRSADIVHLASHALIDREYPELSRLVLSQGTDGEPAFLTPADIDGTPLAARLIVLSACETVGLNSFEFDNRMGFVTQLLQQSEALVIASLWPVSDRVTSEFMETFYQLLAVSGNAPEALRSAKLLYRRKAGPENRAWAAFQLFTH